MKRDGLRSRCTARRLPRQDLDPAAGQRSGSFCSRLSESVTTDPFGPISGLPPEPRRQPQPARFRGLWPPTPRL